MAAAPVVKKSDSLPVILIAGGASYIGSTLIKKLLETQCRIIVVDNLITGKRSYLEPFFSHPRFVFITSDIRQNLPAEVESVNYIIHLAGLETYTSGQKEITFDSLLTNALGTKNLLELAKRSSAKFLLVSSIDVYRGVISSQDLEHYFGRSWAEQRRYTHAEAKRFAEALTWEFFERDHLDSRIVRVGEIYGSGMDLSTGGSLGRLLSEHKAGKELTVYGEGLEKEYYTHASDIVSGIIKSLFGEKTSGKIFPLVPSEPTTPLELVYLIRDLTGGKGKILFKPPLESVPVADALVESNELTTEIGWKPRITLKRGIAEILQIENETLAKEDKVGVKEEVDIPILNFRQDLNIPSEKTETEKIVEEVKEKPKTDISLLNRLSLKIPRPYLSFGKARPTKKAVIIAASLLVVFAGIPSAVLAFSWVRCTRTQASLERQINALAFDSMANESHNLGTCLNQTNDNLDRFSLLFLIVQKRSELESVGNLLQSGVYLSSALQKEAESLTLLTKIVYGLAGSSPQDLSRFGYMQSDLAKGQEDLLLAESYLKEVEIKSLPSPLRSSYLRSVQAVSSLKNSLPSLKKVSNSLPTLLGDNSPQTYLLLIEDANELWPTGGALTSYGKVIIDKGYIREVVVDDIVNLDSLLESKQIKHEPSQVIKEQFAIDRLRFKDTNWDPSYPNFAKSFRQLYEEASGETVNGIITIDSQGLKQFLSLTGPVYIAELNESINADNFNEKLAFYSESASPNTNQQKKTFLTYTTAKILEKLVKVDEKNLPPFVNKLSTLLSERHVALYFPDEFLAAVVGAQGWSGQLTPTDSDYFMVVDANLGATKANYYVKRSLSYSVRPVDQTGNIEATLTAVYVHGAASNAWPGGAYKDYVRVYTPDGSSLTKVVRTGDGVDQKNVEITPEIKTASESGKTVWGTNFVLDAGKTLTLTFTYQLPSRLALSQTNNKYSLDIQKQSGTLADPVTVDFYVPFGRTLLRSPEGSERNGNVWRYSGSLRRDLDLEYLLN